MKRHDVCSSLGMLQRFPSPFARERVRVRVVLILFLIAGNLFAQSNERVYEELDFRFVTPGARAVAMGKTFVGLADDATAAYSNPAGLSNLLQSEISFEFNTTDITHHRFIPSENGQTQAFGDRVYAPSFFSYALPKKSFTFSFFRNVVQHYREDFRWNSRFIPSINHIESGYAGHLDADATDYGIGISYLVHPKFSIGGSVVLSHVDTDIQGITGLVSPRSVTDTVDADTAVGAIVGVLFKPDKKFSLGAVYNTGSKFELTTNVVGEFNTNPQLQDLTGDYPIDYVIPARYSAGIAYRANDHITAAFDASRTRYSQQITDKFLILSFRYATTKENYFIDDVTEIHTGAEYRFYRRGTVIAVRGGLFTDPDHQLHFRPLPGTDQFASDVLSFRFNSLAQHTDVGYTFGGGVAIANRVQIDSAFSFSRDSDEIILSFVCKL